MQNMYINIQPGILNLTTGIRIVFFSLLFTAFSSHPTFAQCPDKDDYKVVIGSSGSFKSISIENNSGLQNFDFILLEVNRGEIDIKSEGIRVNRINNKVEFTNLGKGEYIIQVASNDCKIYLTADKMGTGFIIKEEDR